MSTPTIFHPAHSLRKMLKMSGMTPEELALRLNMSEKHLGEILNEKQSVTTETALKLAQVFWGDASFWIHLQARYDEMAADLLPKIEAVVLSRGALESRE